MTSSPFPNGTTLLSSALTEDGCAKLVQAITAGVFGFTIDPDNPQDPAFARVRVGWPPTGAPGFLQAEDVCFVRVNAQQDAFTDTRDEVIIPGADYTQPATSQVTYNRAWSFRWVHYGPNAFDSARLLISALLLDFTAYQFEAAALALVTEIPAPTRAPELFQGGWWDRTDVTAEFYELVTETIEQPTGISIEILTTGRAPQTLP